MNPTTQNDFNRIIDLIHQSQRQAIKQVNTLLIDLYWQVGQHISEKIASAQWGDAVVSQLASYIQEQEPCIKGFSDKNLWRMKQFYETYKDNPKLSTVLREISWSHNLAIFSRCKNAEEREFYLKTSKKEAYSVRELNRQISASLFERTITTEPSPSSKQLSTALREIQNTKDISLTLKDSYVFDFLNLPETHTESDLQQALVKQIQQFILELGKDFIFIDKEYKLEVGNSDFFIDLLFYHRGLQCLVAFELKTDKFKPSHLGQLNFYLEALDNTVKKPHENPSIGILLCKDKDDEVVEFALNRSLSPTMVAEYQMQLPDKDLLQQKLSLLFFNNDNLEDN